METTRRAIVLPSLIIVLAVHAALLYFLFQQQIIPPPEQLATLLVNFIPSSKPEKILKPEAPPPAPKPKPKPAKKPLPRQLAAKAPVVAEDEPVAPPPEPEPEPEPAPELESQPEPAPAAVADAPVQMPQGPVTLSAELSVACPELSAPAYPALSRRLGEEGKLVLRVELDESGRVSMAEIVDSSGYKRLDEAAMVAVKSWRCNPPERNGLPVRAIALQPFNFVLQGD
jgi:periplasmic protein TonB